MQYSRVTVHYRESESNNYDALRFMVVRFTTIFIHLLHHLPLKTFLETLCDRIKINEKKEK